MKKTFALLLALCMVLSLCACGGAKEEQGAQAAPAAEAVSANLTMGTGGEAGTYYAFGGVLASYVGSNSAISTNVVSTGGTAANITGIDQGLYDLATVQSDVSTYAYFGTNSFADSGAITGFKVLGATGLIVGPLVANLCRVTLDADAGTLQERKQERLTIKLIFKQLFGKKAK